MLGLCPWDMMKQPRAGRLARKIRCRGPQLAMDQLVAVSAAERGDLGAHVGDLEDRGLMLRSAHEGAGAPPPLDQISLCKFRQCLVHSHARAAVACHQFVFERNAVTRRPFAGQYPLLDVGADPLVERRLVGCISGEALATSLRTDALKRSRAD